MPITQQRKNEINTNYYHRNKEKILQRHKTQYEIPEIKQKKHKQYQQWKTSNPKEYILSRVKSSAKRQRIDCNLTIEDINIPEVCPLLLVPFEQGTRTQKDYTPSVDRIDPSKGYIKGNVWIISYKANRMKTDASEKELINFSKGVLKLIQSS